MLEGLEYLRKQLKLDSLEVVTDEGRILATEIGERLRKGTIGKRERGSYLDRARELVAFHKECAKRHARDHGP